MRLIDADAFNEFISNHMDFLVPINTEKVTQSEIHKFINEQPTAYDVDKAVEELESFAKLAEDRWTNGTSKHAYQEHKCWVKAIEIVKNGGVSDDACEWKSVSEGEFIQNPHTKRLYSNEASMKNVYCNTCGKKIKAVE